MMNQSKSPAYKVGRYLLVLPLVVLFLTANSIYAAQREPADIEKEELHPLVMQPMADNNRMPTGQTELANPDQAELQGQGLQQPPPVKNEEIFVIVENQPEFPGGNGAMMKFIGESIRYPVEAQQKGIQGRVICNFVVMKDGSISDLQIVRGVDPLLDAEALRVLGLMPDWKPGKQRGQNVNVRFTLPIVFSLNNTPPTEEERKAFQERMKNMEPAVFPGGEEAYMKFLANNIKYPVIAQEKGIQGLVEAVYAVDAKGKVSFVRIEKGVDPSLDKEVRRVIELMPDWIPAPPKPNGEEVSITRRIPFVFRLEGEDLKESYTEPTPDNAIIVVGYNVKKKGM